MCGLEMDLRKCLISAQYAYFLALQIKLVNLVKIHVSIPGGSFQHLSFGTTQHNFGFFHVTVDINGTS
jgi:hypothetical protein